MGTTAGGIVYPDATDVPDIPADLQALAESVETEYTTGAAWVTASTGFTAAANWTLTSQMYRKVGPIVAFRIGVTRTTSTITVPADGNMTNTAVLSAIPTLIRPTVNQPIGSYGTGRIGTLIVNSDGTCDLAAVSGGANIVATDTMSFGGVYLLGA